MPAVATAAGLPSRLGKYELLLPLAAGGMARIYIARSTGIGSFERHVVVKMITPERANDTTAVNMFLDEARLAASLNHQNVAQVFEVGEDVGIHYLAMEYVHGQDLRALLAKAGSQGTRIPLELALTVVAGAAAGLNHAHERRGPDGTPLGIVHRDVSPSNIMIGYDGAVKLLDFGIAKATSRSVETQSGIIKGKFAYMAPEQCRGRDVDRRSDVFSLGIILYEVSTQHRCFRADSDFDTMHRIVTGDVVRPTRLVAGYPQALEAIVMKALAVDSAQRYQSAGLLLEALESFAVSSRMSLSTMGLGRFMRDMFGEVQEPWLNSSATPMPVVSKESTISSTDGQGSPVKQTLPSDEVANGIPEQEGKFPDSGEMEVQTILDLPGREAGESRDPWNAKTYPSPPPTLDASETLPPGETLVDPPMHLDMTLELPPKRKSAVIDVAAPRKSAPGMEVPQPRKSSPQIDIPQHRSSSPGIDVPQRSSPPRLDVPPPRNSPPRLDPPQRNSPPRLDASPPLEVPSAASTLPMMMRRDGTPVSSLSTTAPGLGVSTKQGYASAALSRADAPYAGYEPPLVSAAELQLAPNRRPLFIGLGIVIVGLIIILAVSLGSKDESEPVGAPGSEDIGDPAKGTELTPKTDNLDEAMVSIVVQSEPSGADVVIAGTKVGVTPLASRLKRGTKVATLLVHLDGYVDFTSKIDSGGEYENKQIKLVPIEAGGSGEKTVPDEPTTTGTGAGTGVTGASIQTGTTTTKATTGTSTAPDTATKTTAGTTTGTATKTTTSTGAATKTGTGAATKPTTGGTATKTTAGTATGTAIKTGTSTTSGTSTKTGTGTTVKTGTGTKTGAGTSSGTGTKTGTNGTKSGTSTNANTGTAEKTGSAATKPKCQPPGPNVDPFSSVPVCPR